MKRNIIAIPFKTTYSHPQKRQQSNQNSDSKQKNNRQKGPWGRFLDSIEKDVDDALIIYKGKCQKNAQNQNKKKGYGIYAQLTHDKKDTRMTPLCSEVNEWLEIFELINENQKLSKLNIKCTFTEDKSEDKDESKKENTSENESEDKDESKKENTSEDESEDKDESKKENTSEDESEDKDEIKKENTSEDKDKNITRDFYIIEYGKNFIRSHLVVEEVMHCLFFSQTQSYIFVGYCSSSSKKVAAPCKTFCAIEKLANFVRDCELYDKMEKISDYKS